MTFQFIYNGIQYVLPCELYKTIENDIPIYKCDKITDIIVINTVENNIIVIVNSELINSLSSEILDITIWYNILDIYSQNIALKDICISSWFGHVNTINFINSQEIPEELKLERIKNIEKSLSLNNRIQSKEVLLQKLIERKAG